MAIPLVSPPPLVASDSRPLPWSVVVGAEIPNGTIREVLGPALSSLTERIPAAREAAVEGRGLGKQTFWMALTQMADVVTQSMGPDGTPFTGERLMLASATAVLSLTMRKRPRLRKWLVRLGALGMGLMQGSAVFSVIEKAVGDPQLLGSLAPNLAAQGVALLAILKLFTAAGNRR